MLEILLALLVVELFGFEVVEVVAGVVIGLEVFVDVPFVDVAVTVEAGFNVLIVGFGLVVADEVFGPTDVVLGWLIMPMACEMAVMIGLAPPPHKLPKSSVLMSHTIAPPSPIERRYLLLTMAKAGSSYPTQFKLAFE